MKSQSVTHLEAAVAAPVDGGVRVQRNHHRLVAGERSVAHREGTRVHRVGALVRHIERAID